MSKRFDLRDALAVLGLAMIGVGLGMVSVALALVVVGAVVLIAALRPPVGRR